MHRLLAAVLLLALAVPAVQAQQPMQVDPPPETEFYPLKVGSTWTYKNKSSGPNTEIVVRVVGVEKFNDESLVKLETSAASKVRSFEYLTVRADGVYRMGINGTTILISATDPKKTGLLLFPLPPKSGHSWKVHCKLRNPRQQKDEATFEGTFTQTEEDVRLDDETLKFLAVINVPVDETKKTVKAWKVVGKDVMVGNQKTTIESIYVPNVGLVQQTLRVGNATQMIELTRYSAGSGK